MSGPNKLLDDMSKLMTSAMGVAQGAKDLVLVNNSFVQNGDSAAKMSEDDGGHVLFNNLLVGNVDNRIMYRIGVSAGRLGLAHRRSD